MNKTVLARYHLRRSKNDRFGRNHRPCHQGAGGIELTGGQIIRERIERTGARIKMNVRFKIIKQKKGGLMKHKLKDLFCFGTLVFLVFTIIVGTNVSADDGRIKLLEEKIGVLQEKVAVLEKRQISQKDLAALEKLTIEFADELAFLNIKVSKLEEKIR